MNYSNRFLVALTITMATSPHVTTLVCEFARVYFIHCDMRQVSGFLQVHWCPLLSCNNVAPVTNLCLGRATTRSHSSQWSKKKVAVET